MKHIFLTITLFSMLAILPVAIFAQTASNKCVSGNCVNGRGKIVFASGNTYEGDFVNGKLEGRGTYKFVDGGIYTGQFSNGVVNGKGKTIYANGDIYEGDYVNGKRQGQGTYTTKDGSYYSGEFKNGLGNGNGKHYDKSTNTTNEGIFKDDVFMGAATQSNDPKPSYDLQADLQRLNQLLKTIDGGSTPLAEIIDGTIYFRKKDGSSRSLKLNEISKVGFLFEYSDVNWVALLCKNGKKCVYYSDATGTRVSDDSFTIHALNGFETTELFTILNNVVSHSQPNSSSVAKKAGSLSDCKLILSEGCRNFLLNSTIDELRSPLKLEKRSENVFGSYDRFEVTVDPSSGVVIEIKIYKKSGWKPNNDIKWGEGMTKVQEKLADAVTYSSSYFGSLHLNDVEMKFYDGDLGSISLTRVRTATEELANYVRYYEKKNGELALARSREEAEARKTPEQKAQEIADAKARKEGEMQDDYKSLLNRLEIKLEEGNRIVNSEKLAIAAGGMFKDAVQKKLDKVRDAGDSLIDSFSKKYQGMIPAWMVKGIQEKWRPIPVSQ